MTNPTMPQIYLLVNGTNVAATTLSMLEEVVVESTLHLPGMATLAFHDPEMTLIDGATLVPGDELVISVKVGPQPSTIFDGEIVALEPAFSGRTQRLVVRAFDRLHRLSKRRHTKSYLNVTDSDVRDKLAGECGLRTDSKDKTRTVHPHLLQANQTDLEFLQSCAASLGKLLRVEGSKLLFSSPVVESGAELSWDKGLREFHPRLTASTFVKEVTVRSWDYKTKKELVGKASTSASTAQIGSVSSFSTALTPPGSQTISDCRVLAQGDATTLANAHLARLNGQFIEAEGSAAGIPSLVAGNSVTISSVGTRFSGKYLITSATHRYDATNGYGTDFSLTSGQTASLLSLLMPQPAHDLGVGLMIGIVTDNADPEKIGRVKVKLPWLSDTDTPDWARVVSIGGGKARGIMFTPEVNDEVLVGFEQGNLNRPYVLGGLWNGQDAPAIAAADAVKNGVVAQRALVSRSGHKIILDDTQGSEAITIIDKGGNKFVIKSQDNSLTIETKGNITVESKGNISLKAAGNMALEATGNLSLKANASLTAEAGAKAELKGNTGVDVSSPAITNVKGSMLNLN